MNSRGTRLERNAHPRVGVLLRGLATSFQAFIAAGRPHRDRRRVPMRPACTRPARQGPRRAAKSRFPACGRPALRARAGARVPATPCRRSSRARPRAARARWGRWLSRQPASHHRLNAAARTRSRRAIEPGRRPRSDSRQAVATTKLAHGPPRSASSRPGLHANNEDVIVVTVPPPARQAPACPSTSCAMQALVNASAAHAATTTASADRPAVPARRGGDDVTGSSRFIGARNDRASA
jgi:hypothetical protein